ncbi:hypothetical protein TNCV_1008061 [Trichonephila clavipes]|nr:hypothetical protein TNCV_1008061 [Trichonephila clavipes]
MVRASSFHTTGPRLNPGLGKVDSAFHPFSRSIKLPSLLGNLTLGVSRQVDHQTGTSAHSPQSPRSSVLSWALQALAFTDCHATELS